MIEITENRNPAVIQLLERAGLDPKQYISVLNESTYLHAMNIDTGEFVIIEKETAKVVKSPGALACSPGHKKIKTNQIIGQNTKKCNLKSSVSMIFRELKEKGEISNT